MASGYYVTGTDTAAGKTFASVALLHALRARGLRAVGMKPVASGCELRSGKHRLNRAVAVLGDGVGIVLGAVADVEAGNHSLRNPAAPPEEAVRHSGERLRANDLDLLSQGCA